MQFLSPVVECARLLVLVFDWMQRRPSADDGLVYDVLDVLSFLVEFGETFDGFLLDQLGPSFP